MAKIDDNQFKIVLKHAIQHVIDEDIAQTEAVFSEDKLMSDEKMYRRIWNKAKRKAKAEKPWNSMLKHVAMIAVAVLSATFLIMGTYTMHVGAAVENIKISENSQFYTLQFMAKSGENPPATIEEEIIPSYIPYDWPTSKMYPHNYGLLMEIRTSDKGLITFSQRPRHAIIKVKRECKMKTVIIGKSAGKMFLYDDGSIRLIWFDNYVFELYGRGIDTATVIEMAKSVK